MALCEITDRALNLWRPHVFGGRIDQVAQAIHRNRFANHGFAAGVLTNHETRRRRFITQIAVKSIRAVRPASRDVRHLVSAIAGNVVIGFRQFRRQRRQCQAICTAAQSAEHIDITYCPRLALKPFALPSAARASGTVEAASSSPQSSDENR